MDGAEGRAVIFVGCYPTYAVYVGISSSNEFKGPDEEKLDFHVEKERRRNCASITHKSLRLFLAKKPEITRVTHTDYDRLELSVPKWGDCDKFHTSDTTRAASKRGHPAWSSLLYPLNRWNTHGTLFHSSSGPVEALVQSKPQLVCRSQYCIRHAC